MSKPTVSAAGGAMPASGQPNIADAFDETRRLIIAASNLAAAIDDTQAQGLHAVICAAEEKFMVALGWFEAGGHEQRVSAPIARAADPDPRRDLLHICDDIDEVRHLIEAVWMGVEALSDVEHDREAQSALHAVLNVAKGKLTAARDKLDVARGAKPQPEGRADV
jgi:hypothetical protein